MTPAELSRTVVRAVRCAVEAGELSAPVPERVTVRTPPRPGCGDFATNVALRLAKDAGRSAHDVAEVLRRRLLREPGVQCVDVAGAGFLNITLDGAGHAALIEELRAITPSPALPLAPPDDLVRRLGPDAARWSLVTAPGFDRDLLLVQRDANPLFRVRYAHARTQALLRNARDLGFGPQAGDIGADDSAVLLGVLGDRERIVGASDPVRLARYLERLADAFLHWHHKCPVLPRGDEKPSAVHRARLALAEATGAVLADGLHQLGITAPAHV
ncbi:ArgS-related anticodon-binding protein NrtL [Streptomyces sp. NPDC050617]|uniref:ArgS-related anticodon-binding protein NrtL n=1 Tax=Streptomyces sp. NPDC050617 TaxID=3154628 RepID=UPI00344603EC